MNESTSAASQRQAALLRRQVIAGLGGRVVATLGPHPVQPVVVRSGLEPGLAAALRDLFLGLAEDPGGAEILTRYRILRFVEPVEPS